MGLTRCYKTEVFLHLLGVRTVFWISTQLDILCTSAVKRYYAESDILPFTCGLSRKQRNLPPSSLQLSLVNFLLWRALQQNVFQDFQDLIIWSAFHHTAGSHKPGRYKRVPLQYARPTAKKATIVFRVHRHVESFLPVDLTSYLLALIVNSLKKCVQ